MCHCCVALAQAMSRGCFLFNLIGLGLTKNNDKGHIERQDSQRMNHDELLSSPENTGVFRQIQESSELLSLLFLMCECARNRLDKSLFFAAVCCALAFQQGILTQRVNQLNICSCRDLLTVFYLYLLFLLLVVVLFPPVLTEHLASTLNDRLLFGPL